MANQADSLKAMNQAVCDGLRQMYVLGRLKEAEVRTALTPDADLRKQLDEATQLVLALTAANQKMRETCSELQRTLDSVSTQNLNLYRGFQELCARRAK